MMQAGVERLWRRAQDHLARGQVVSARAVLHALVARHPSFLHAHLVLGGIAWQQDRMEEAVQHACAAAGVVGDDPLALLAVNAGLVHVGEYAAARDGLRHPVFDRSTDPGVLAQAAALMQRIGDHAAAMVLYDRAGVAGCDGPDFRFARATEMSFNGRLEQAEAELERCATEGTTIGRAWLELARLRRQTPARNHLDLLERRRASLARGSADEAAIEFARYKELEDLERHGEAWEALSHGNAIMAGLTRYDAAREERLHAGLREVFATPPPRAGIGEQEGPQPIFIVGMTRSGTSLLDRILGNHPLVESAGELGDFGRQLRRVARRCTNEMLDERLLERLPEMDYADVGRRFLAQTQWRANGRPFFVDKLPFNWLLAGPILRALPRARIVNLVRDPMDVCFSNLRAFYGDAHGWSYDQRRLAHHHGQYRRMMAHWHALMPGRILDVAYAELVRDPEATARQAFAFCGLEFADGCLDLSRNRSAVATLSMAQVRSGIRAAAFRDWLPYEEGLKPLRAALDRLPP